MANLNCAFAGSSTATRINPLLITRLCPMGPPGVAVGQLAPSTAANSGSVPLLLVNKACVLAALIDIPWLSSWQVAHARALAPRGWKKTPLGSTLPVVLSVATVPVGVVKGCKLGIELAVGVVVVVVVAAAAFAVLAVFAAEPEPHPLRIRLSERKRRVWFRLIFNGPPRCQNVPGFRAVAPMDRLRE